MMKLNIQKFASLNVGDTYETTPVNIKPYGYSSNAYQMKFTVKLNSQNLSNFTSNITITSYMRTLNNSWGWSGFNKIYMERYTKANDEAGYTFRNNTQLKSLPTNNANNWVNCGSWSDNIQHKSNGTCTLYVKNHLLTATSSSYSYIPQDTEQESEAITLHQLHKSPEITIDTITELNSNLTGVANNTFVQNLSKKRFTFTPGLYDSATVQGVTISNGSTSVTGTTSPLVLNFTNKNLYTTANILPIKAVISDNYNSTGEANVNYSSYILYNKPTINTSTTVKRNGQLSGKALLNLSATFYNATIGSKTNTITVKYRFWEKNTTEPNTWIIIPSNSVIVNHNDVTVSNYEIGSTDTSASNYFNFQKAYNVKIYIVDAMQDADNNYMSDTVTKTISLGKDVWGEYKDRVRIDKLQNPNGIYSYQQGNVSSPSATGTLIIKKANNSEAPNNGIVLEYGNSSNWTGQLYIGDNATQGIYYNGWSNGTRGSWRRLADIPVTLYNDDTGIQSKSYASVSNLSSYRKLAITFTVYKNSDYSNTGGTAHICWLDLTKKDTNNYARAGITVPYSNSHLSDGNIQSNDFKALFEADFTNNRVYCLFAYSGTVQISANYVMTKIEGYYN